MADQGSLPCGRPLDSPTHTLPCGLRSISIQPLSLMLDAAALIICKAVRGASGRTNSASRRFVRFPRNLLRLYADISIQQKVVLPVLFQLLSPW